MQGGDRLGRAKCAADIGGFAVGGLNRQGQQTGLFAFARFLDEDIGLCDRQNADGQEGNR